LISFFLSASVGANESLRTTDTFFAGYITAILGRDLEWEQDSYRLDIWNGIAIITFLKWGDERGAEATIARVNDVICSGCGICKNVCPYNAIENVTEGEKSKARVTDARSSSEDFPSKIFLSMLLYR